MNSTQCNRNACKKHSNTSINNNTPVVIAANAPQAKKMTTKFSIPMAIPCSRKTEQDAEGTRRRKNKTQKEPDARLDARLATIEEEEKIDLIKQEVDEVDEVDEVTGCDRQQ